MISWLAESSLVRQAEDALEQALADETSGDSERTARLLEAAGRLVALNQDAGLNRRLEGKIGSEAAVLAALERARMADALEDAAIRLAERLSEHEERALEEGDPEFEPAVLELLGVRDRAEYELLGASAVLSWTPEDVAARTTIRGLFDDVVRPHVWRLVELNEARQRVRIAVAPELRSRFWWWHAGSGIAASALAKMASVAELVGAFPEARSRFESLVRARQVWSSPAGPGRAGGVVTLRTWLLRRAKVPEAALPLAAAGADEQTVLETAFCEVSFAPPARLIVDLIAQRRSGATPTLRVATGSVIPSSPVANAEERFAFALPAAALEGSEITLQLPLSDGDIELVLPPPGGR